MAAILTFIVTACLISQYCTADAAAVDVTLLSSTHFLDDSSQTQFLCRVPWPQDTITQHTFSGETPNTRPIIREGGTGPGNPFIVSSSQRVANQNGAAYGAIFMADAGDTRVGAFSCSVEENGLTGKAVSFKIKNTAYVLPTAFTVRANVGESATLRVSETSSWQQSWTDNEVRWSKDGQEIQGRQGLQLTIDNVQASDGGIYEAYRTGERNTWNHAFSRLIVRACRAGLWGLPACSNTCPACYNGGVCDPETGRCICPPGFSGTNCNKACDATYNFGPTCNHQCDSADCSSKLLCPADPFGCTCGAGYRGIRCDQPCSAGTFGAGCTQTCNCIGTCNMATGACDAQGCSAGWSGPSCQVPGPVDVTVESSSHILEGTAASQLLCRSARGTIRQTQSWPFRREGGAGPGNPFGVGSTQRVGNYGARFMSDAGNTRVGAFSCQVDSDGRSGSAVAFKVKGNAYLLPEAFTTTVSVGEPVTLKMTKTNTWQANWFDIQVKWRKDGEVLHNRQGLQLAISSVQTSDAGIYEAYRDGEENNWNHAFSRLIVRACPTNKWGPDCRNRCPVCYNGGVCHVETGRCVCAPGFRGDSCQSVCDSPQKFGSTCQATCAGSSCQRKLLCPADPFGCTCGPTYTGVRCDGACPDGRFGPGCTQMCHCKGTCTRATGVCDQQGCAAGWSGPNCQVVSTNAVDFFATPVENRVLNTYTAVRHNGVNDAQCAKYCLQGTGLAGGLTCRSFDMFSSGGSVQCRLNTQNKDVQGSPGLSDNTGGKYYQREDLSSCSSLPCANGTTCLDRAEQQYTCICSPGWMGTNCDLASSNPLDYFAKYSGSNLEGNDAETIQNVASSEECARRCLQGTETVPRDSCQSFDYRISERKCFLSTATKETNPQHFRQGNADLEYYQREASGPCSNLPCQLPQRCQTPASGSGYQCFCPNGRLGPNCNVEAQVDVGIESKNYLVGTANVEMYCRTVRGNIIQNNINNVNYPFTREKRGKIDIGNPLNTSLSRKIYNYGVFLHEPAGDLRLGPFSCQVQQGGQTSKVVTLNMKNDAKVKPNVITQTVNVGERATLSVTPDSGISELTWHRDGDLVTGVQTNEYTINSVRQANAGVYEVFQPGRYHRYEHAFMRFIVRGCTKDRWGPPDCLGFCPVCRNGGVCDDATGVCVCAPGFRGVNCEKACPAGFFGPTCRSRCTFTNCREKLICLPDPYGCSCAAGFKGLDCNQECDAGTFGPGCTLTCNCQSGGCSSTTGSCTNGCKPGWSGDSCQIASNSPIDYFSKRENHFLLNGRLTELTDTSVDECARRCVSESEMQCKSVNYFRDENKCWLNNKNPGEGDPAASLVPMNTRDNYKREDFSGCSMVPCLNQGACSVSDTPAGYSCTCAPGFTGSTCSKAAPTLEEVSHVPVTPTSY